MIGHREVTFSDTRGFAPKSSLAVYTKAQHLLRLTPSEMTKCRKRLRKGNDWKLSEAQIAKELIYLGRGAEAFLKSLTSKEGLADANGLTEQRVNAETVRGEIVSGSADVRDQVSDLGVELIQSERLKIEQQPEFGAENPTQLAEDIMKYSSKAQRGLEGQVEVSENASHPFVDCTSNGTNLLPTLNILAVSILKAFKSFMRYA
jgi:hypothetical protein